VTASDVPSVLFLCVHNAGRSQMAAGWLRHLAGDTVAVYSGGSKPAAAVNHAAVEAMTEVGIDLREQRPRRWADADLQTADVVVTMGCGDTCPFYPGKRYEDWDVDDPAGLDVAAVRPIRDEIRRRVEALIVSLATTSAAISSPSPPVTRGTPRPSARARARPPGGGTSPEGWCGGCRS